ncbi:MAG: hypothetical protein RIQ81_203 [Pseudomonadota bacterium]|jgi:hypothetical protein
MVTLSTRMLNPLLVVVAVALFAPQAWSQGTVPAAKPGAAARATPKPTPKPPLEQAREALRDRDFKKAAKMLEVVRREKPLDYQGLFSLSYAYRQLEECRKAVPPLKEIQTRANKKKLNAREAKIVRAGLFLLARCYAKGNDLGRTMFILNGYLLDPRKYASELRQSLTLLDFGGLRSHSDFQDYEKAARKALGRVGVSTDGLSPDSPSDNSFPDFSESSGSEGTIDSGTGF